MNSPGVMAVSLRPAGVVLALLVGTLCVRGQGIERAERRTAAAQAVTTPPNAPLNLNAQTVSWNQINLTWMDNSDNELGFRIERNLELRFDGWTEIARLPANHTAYQDGGLQKDTTYYYRVVSYNEAGDSPGFVWAPAKTLNGLVSGVMSVADYFPLNLGDEHRLADGSVRRVTGTRSIHYYTTYLCADATGAGEYYSCDAAGTLRLHGMVGADGTAMLFDRPIELGYANMSIPQIVSGWAKVTAFGQGGFITVTLDYRGVDEASVHRLALGTLRRTVPVYRSVRLFIPYLQYDRTTTSWECRAKRIGLAAAGNPNGPAFLSSCKVGNRVLPGPAARDAFVAGHTMPDLMTTGESRPVSITLRNEGFLPWHPDDGFRLGAVGGADPFVAGAGRLDLPANTTVLPGESHTFTAGFTAPPAPGTYRSGWQLVQDGLGWFGPVVARDIVVRPIPDLVAAGGSVRPDQARPGESARVTFRIRNAGNGWAGATWAHVYLSTDGVHGPDDLPWVTGIRVPALNPGEVFDFAGDAMLPNVARRPYRVLAQCDVIDEVAEGNENNNVADLGDLRVAQGPDLVVSAGKLDRGRCVAGQKTCVTLRITNAGDCPARPSWAHVYLSADPVYDPGDQLWISGIQVPELAPGRWFEVSRVATVPRRPARLNFTLARCDVIDDVTESDEANNTAMIGILDLTTAAAHWTQYR